MSIARGAASAGMGLNFDEQWVIQFSRVGDYVHLIRKNLRYEAPGGTPLEKAVQQLDKLIEDQKKAMKATDEAAKDPAKANMAALQKQQEDVGERTWQLGHELYDMKDLPKEQKEKLLERLARVERRSARFRCVLVVYQAGEWCSAEGVLEGEITQAPRGEGGFGYDPVFAVPALGGRTLAEARADEKNRISHRAAAMRELIAALVPGSAPDGR